MASATTMNAVTTHLEQICLDLSREVLRSPQLPQFHEDDQALYTFLADYFEVMKERFQHEDAIAITAQDATFVLRDIYGQSKLADSSLQERKAMSAIQGDVPTDDAARLSALYDSIAVSSSGPFMSQRTLREQLQSGKINVSALSEVLELCRLLDTKFNVPVPFGQVNVTHFAAVFCTLYPTDALIDLIDVVFSALPPTRGTAKGPDGRPGTARGTAAYRASDLQKIRIFHCWAAIDDVNATVLRELALCVLRRPNLTLPLVLDAMPSLKHAHTASYDSAHAGEKAAGVVAAYGDDDERVQVGPGGSATASLVVAAVVYADDDDAGGADAAADDDYDSGDDAAESTDAATGAAAGDGGFWSALVS